MNVKKYFQEVWNMTTAEQNIVYLLPDIKYGKFITRLLHTPESNCYRILNIIQGATEFKRKIPKGSC